MLQSLPEGGEVPGSFVLVQADTGQVIGLTGSKGGPDEAGQVEIGYGLIPPTWGQGVRDGGGGGTGQASALVAGREDRDGREGGDQSRQ